MDMSESGTSVAPRKRRKKPDDRPLKTAALIVAHPDDETLWAGGFVLEHPSWEWLIISLCRGNDPERAPRFARAVKRLGGSARMGRLNDDAEQSPLPPGKVDDLLRRLLASRKGTPFDLVITHGPRGEYTRHRRHEEVSRAVAGLWSEGQIQTRTLWMFAYEDEHGRELPHARRDAHVQHRLPGDIWREKYRIIRHVYGFANQSFEARTTPVVEAFWRFTDPSALETWELSPITGKDESPDAEDEEASEGAGETGDSPGPDAGDDQP